MPSEFFFCPVYKDQPSSEFRTNPNDRNASITVIYLKCTLHLLNMHLSVFTISHLALIHLVLVNWSLWESKLRHM